MRGGERGFTLIELIIAITLVSAIATGLLMSMRTALLAMERTQVRLDQNRRATALQKMVRNQLGAAMPVEANCSGARSAIFRGDASSLLMVSSYSMEEGARGYPRIVSYRVEQESRGTVRLVADEFLFSGPQSTTQFCQPGGVILPVQTTPRTLVIASGLASCTFSYRMMNPFLGVGTQWQTRWIQPDLPAAIRIDVVPVAADPAGMPVLSISVPLHINKISGELYADN